MEIFNDKINTRWISKKREFGKKCTEMYNKCRKNELFSLWSLIKTNLLEMGVLENSADNGNMKSNKKLTNQTDEKLTNHTNKKLSNVGKVHTKKTDPAKKWFQILLNLSYSLEELFFNPPKDFHKYLLRLGYKTLKRTEFCIYLDQGVFEIDQDFIQELIDKKEKMKFISRVIFHLKGQKNSLKHLMKHCKQNECLLQYLSSKHYQSYANWDTGQENQFDTFTPYEISLELFQQNMKNTTNSSEMNYLINNFNIYLPDVLL